MEEEKIVEPDVHKMNGAGKLKPAQEGELSASISVKPPVPKTPHGRFDIAKKPLCSESSAQRSRLW
jgi:hypothetical protein